MDTVIQAGWELMALFLTVVGGAILANLGLIMRHFLKGKAQRIALALERDIRYQLSEAMRDSIVYADQMAKSGATGKTNEDRMATALKRAMDNIEAWGLPAMSKAALTDAIEAELGSHNISRFGPAIMSGLSEEVISE